MNWHRIDPEDDDRGVLYVAEWPDGTSLYLDMLRRHQERVIVKATISDQYRTLLSPSIVDAGRAADRRGIATAIAALHDGEDWPMRIEEAFARLASALESEERADSPEHPVRPIDWSAFWATDFKAEDWLIEPILPRGRSASTFAPAGVGKSELWLFLAACLATGRRVLDRPAGPPVDVALFDYEMTEPDVRERLEELGFGPEADLGRLHYFSLPELPPLDTKEGGAEVLRLIEECGAELVVFDSVSRLLGEEENASEGIRSFFRLTIWPLKARGCTIVQLDHPGKKLRLGERGTSAKRDAVDVAWELTRREGGARLTARKRRQAWLPESVDLVRLEDPLRYELAAQRSWPSGTIEAAALLDDLGVPLDWGRVRVREKLSSAGQSVQNTVLAAAIRWRKRQSEEPNIPRTASRTGAPDALRTGGADSFENRFADRCADRCGQVAAADTDRPPPLGGGQSSRTADSTGEGTEGADAGEGADDGVDWADDDDAAESWAATLAAEDAGEAPEDGDDFEPEGEPPEPLPWDDEDAQRLADELAEEAGDAA